MATDSAVTVAARLDRLPASRHTLKLITLLSLGGWFEFYDLFFTAYVAPGMFKAGLFKPTTQGLFDLHGFASFVAAGFAGMFIGTLAFSWVSDRFGRRSIFTFALLWYSIGALVMAFQTTPESIVLWRLIAGIGLGVELVNIDAYVSELVPKEQRGPAFAYNQFVMYTAVPVIAFLAWHLVPRTIFGLDGWRWVVIIGSIGALIIWWIRRGLPESPRWLAQHGRIAEAERIVEDFERRSRAETGAELPEPQLVAGEAERKPGTWMEMWSPSPRPHHHAGGLPSVSDHRLLRLLELGRHAAPVAGHRGHEIARLYVHHRHGRAGRAAGRRLFRRPLRAQMAGGLLRSRHRRVRPVVLTADNGPWRDRLRSSDHAMRQLVLVLVPRLPGRTLSDPHPRPGRGLRLFLEPVQRHLLRLPHCFLPRRYGTIGVQLYRRRDGDRVHRYQLVRPGGHPAPPRSDCGVAHAARALRHTADPILASRDRSRRRTCRMSGLAG
jgi:hypothetical protein